MNYKGKLYGKIAGKYFDTGVTSEDYDRLTDWKESMMKVHSELDLQGIGKALGLPLGSSIAPQVLPRVQELHEQNAELIDLLKGIVKQIEKGEKIGGINLLTTSSIEYEYAQKLLTKYNHLKSNTNESNNKI